MNKFELNYFYQKSKGDPKKFTKMLRGYLKMKEMHKLHKKIKKDKKGRVSLKKFKKKMKQNGIEPTVSGLLYMLAKVKK